MNALCVCFLLHVFQTGNARSQQANGKRPPAPKKDPRKASSLHPMGSLARNFLDNYHQYNNNKNTSHHPQPSSKGQVGSLGVHPHQTTKRRPKPLVGGGQGKLPGEPQAKETFSSDHNGGEDRGRAMEEPRKNQGRAMEEPWKSHGRATEEPKCPLTPPVTGAVQGLRSFSKPRIRRLSLL